MRPIGDNEKELRVSAHQLVASRIGVVLQRYDSIAKGTFILEDVSVLGNLKRCYRTRAILKQAV